jgi:hypothetical protein
MLQLVYVPHLDYDLQRFGPQSAQAQKAMADVAAAIEPLLNAVLNDGGKVLIVSEYAIEAVDRSIQPNALLREAGLLTTLPTADGNLIDYQRSKAFAMVDHQIAHLYSSEPSAAELLSATGLSVLDRAILNHPRAGDVLLEAPPGAWLDYRWWRDPADAPSFARTVDIHRKPGYDPLELFIDPKARAISQDAHLIRGSHGRRNSGQAVLLGSPNPTRQDVEMSEVSKIVQGMF